MTSSCACPSFFRSMGVVAALSVALLSPPGCSVGSSIDRNTEAITASSVTIAENTKSVRGTTEIFVGLTPSFQRLGDLKAPMEGLVALGPTFERVARLEAPLQEVGKLGAQLDRVAALREPLLEVSALKERLEEVGGLEASLGAVAGLAAPLRDTGQLRSAMERLDSLKEPLETLGRLGGPMSRLSSFATLERALLICLGAGVMVFFAVWAGMRCALRGKVFSAP